MESKNRLKKDLVKIADITSNTVSNSIFNNNNNKSKKLKNKIKGKKRINKGVYFGHGAKRKKSEKKCL